MAADVDHMPGTAPQTPIADESFGRRLRRERERRQIALASIAANSKISLSLLEGLERDDVSRWPSRIFRRSFIRAYAQAVGLDTDATTREFLERFPDPNDPDLVTPRHSSARSALRLTLADTGDSFIGGCILRSVHSRWAALTCDVTVIATFGVAIYLLFGTLWMPLCVASIGYYAGGILLLGNTPGVRLCAPGRHPKSPTSGTGTWRRIWSSAPQTLRSRLAAAGDRDVSMSEFVAESHGIH